MHSGWGYVRDVHYDCSGVLDIFEVAETDLTIHLLRLTGSCQDRSLDFVLRRCAANSQCAGLAFRTCDDGSCDEQCEWKLLNGVADEEGNGPDPSGTNLATGTIEDCEAACDDIELCHSFTQCQPVGEPVECWLKDRTHVVGTPASLTTSQRKRNCKTRYRSCQARGSSHRASVDLPLSPHTKGDHFTSAEMIHSDWI